MRTDGANSGCVRRVGLLAWVLAPCLAGCGIIGATSISVSRERYHDAIRRTGEEQMLLNLVRLQYDDLPFFLQVTQVNAALKASLGLSVGPKITSGEELGATLQGNIEESPTITYLPLAGEEYVNALLRRIPEQQLVLLLRSNWRVSMVVKLFVHELGRLHNVNVKAPTSPEIWGQYGKLKEVLALLDDLADRGLIDFDNEYVPPQISNSAKTDTAAKDPAPGPTGPAVSPPTPDTKPDTINKDTWPVVRLRQPEAEMSPRDQDEWRQVLSELGVCHARCCSFGPRARHCDGGNDSAAFFLLPSHLEDTRLDYVDYVPITMRSILEVMMTVSGGVSVPEGSAHRMPTATCDDSTRNVEAMNELFHVYCSAHVPHDAALRVHFRDKWYYIKKEDYESKQVFSMVLLMFQEQMPKAVTPAGPLLTLPVNR